MLHFYSGVIMSSVTILGSSARLHSVACTCAACQPVRLATTPAARISSAGIQNQVFTVKLSTEQKQIVNQLKARDQEVKAHEAAHQMAGQGLIVSGPSYVYQQGPDGLHYAIGGEVQIDTAPASTPAESLQKAQKIRAAALAPMQPSAPDRAVADAATQMELEAHQALAKETSEKKLISADLPSTEKALQKMYHGEDKSGRVDIQV